MTTLPIPMSAPDADPTPSPPLTDDEVSELAELLFTLPEDFEPLDIVALDGYLAALSLVPEVAQQGDWLWRVVGQPDYVPGEALSTIPGRLGYLIVRRQQELATYIAAREPFDPILEEMEDEDGAPLAGRAGVAALETWAEGFMLALSDLPELGERIDASADSQVAVMRILRHLPDDIGSDDEHGAELIEAKAELDELDPLADIDDAIESLNDAILDLADIMQPRRPTVRSEPKVGRNDPCPCGSGRKYKRCHGS